MSPRLPIRLLAAQPDRRLVELVQGGHERAFEVLVHRHRRQLLRYCRRLGLSDARAEDALQQSLLRAWLALRRGAEVRELRPWLYRIVHNTAVNLLRSSREDDAPLSELTPVAIAGRVEGEFERRIAAREALADVAALPQMQRDAILLSAVDGRSHEEVANVLGVSDGAVRGLLYRARATLRSAAAALTPQPLLAWAAGGANRVAPAATRVAELSSATGGAEVGSGLLKGVAVAVSGVAAAGAVLAPAPHHPAVPASRAPSAATVSAPAVASTPGLRASAERSLAASEDTGRPALALSGSGRSLRANREGEHARHRSGDGRGHGPGRSGDREDTLRRGSDGSLHGGRDGRDGSASGTLARSSEDSRRGGSGPSGSSGGDSSVSMSGSGSTSGSSGSGSSDGGSGDREAQAAREQSEREAAAREAEATTRTY